MEPEQGRSQIINRYPTRQQQHQAPTPRLHTQKRTPIRTPRVDSSELPVDISYQGKPGRIPRVTPSEVPI